MYCLRQARLLKVTLILASYLDLGVKRGKSLGIHSTHVPSFFSVCACPKAEKALTVADRTINACVFLAVNFNVYYIFIHSLLALQVFFHNTRTRNCQFFFKMFCFFNIFTVFVLYTATNLSVSDGSWDIFTVWVILFF